MPKHQIKRKVLGSYPYLSVIFSISMALLVIGLFGLLVIYTNKIGTILKENIEMHVYLDTHLSKAERNLVLKSFYSKDYIALKEGKRQVFFVPKDTAAKRFIKETGEDFLKFLGENPLHDAFVIKINYDYSDKNALKLIKNELEELDGIFEVTYIENLVVSINKNIRRIGLLLLGFSIFLFLVVYILINNSIKLALYSQRFLIRSMQLVGATAFFIQGPFLVRSFFIGLLAGVIANILLFSLVQYAYTYIPELQLIEDLEHFTWLASILCFSGALVGLISSAIAVNKYLKMSLNDLY